MKKTFTNHFLIKCLLAFMAILLVPSGAWGQSSTIVYEFTGVTENDGNYELVSSEGNWSVNTSCSYTEGTGVTFNDSYIHTTITIDRIVKIDSIDVYCSLGDGTTLSTSINADLNSTYDFTGSTITDGYCRLAAGQTRMDSYSDGYLQMTINLESSSETASFTISKIVLNVDESYGITIGETEVTSANASDVFPLDETNAGKVSYTASTNTLNLSGATLNGGIVYTGETDLTINLSGTNTLGSMINWYTLLDEVESRPALSFTKNGDCSLSITCNDGIISGFSGVSFGNGVYLHTPGPATYNSSYINTLTEEAIDSVIISSTPSYELWVGGVQATSGTTIYNDGNADYNSISGTVSFNPTGNILTMSDDSSIGSTDSRYGPIISNLPNLTIQFDGNCRLRGYQNGSLNTGIPAIKSLVANAPLLFTSNAAETSQLQVYGSTLSDGCAVSTENQLIYELSDGYYYIRELKKPDMGLDGGLYININSENSSEDISLYYKIIAADGTVGAEQTYSEILEISSPCTIKAYAKYQNQVSDTAVAKYFGYATKPIKAVYTGSAIDVTPTFVPSLESTDGISTYMTGNNVNVDSNTSTATMTEIGCGIITTQFNTSGTTVTTTLLNTDTIQCQVLMLPPAPTVKRAAGEYLSTDSITITKNDTNDNTTLWYKWGENGTDTQYTDSIPVQEGTLYTWVKYYKSSTDAYPTLYSDTTSVAYTVKTDIATSIVSGETSATFTGSAITPGFTLIDSNTETTISSDNYTLSYKQGETAVESMVNVGTYTITVTGTGSYGGTKEIEYTISQANLNTVTIAAVANQTYTGAAITPEPAVTLGEYTLKKGTDFTFSYENNTDVPEENSEAQPTITLTAVEDGNFTGETTKTFNITAMSLADAVIADIPDRVFKNDTISPVLTVTLGDKTLVAYEDYSVYYEDNVDVGTATATIEGMGNYTGSLTKNYNIIAAPSSVATAPTAKTDLVYANDALALINPGTGTNGTMKYALGDNDETAPTEGYTEDAPTGTAAGTYYVWYKVVANANYSDTEPTVITATISKATPEITKTPTAVSGLVYNGEEKTLISAGVTTGGTMQYAIGSEGTYSAELPKATNAGSYKVYYKVVGGDNYEDIAAKYLTVSLDSASITAAAENVAVTYDGEAHGITVNVTVPTDNYTIKYSEDNQSYSSTKPTVTNVTSEAKTIWYQVIADNYHTYTGYATITITAKSIENTTIGEIAAQAYTGKDITPAVTVKDGETTLTKDTDYTLEYRNNIELGTATVAITGKGNYQGTIQTSFTINTQLDITFAEGQTWTTYVSTFNLTVPTGLKAYVVTSVSGTTVNVSQIEYLPAEIAVLIEKTSEAGNTFTAEAYPEEIPEITNMLQATFEETLVENLDASNVYVLYNNEFRRTESGKIPAYKGYLTTDGTAVTGARLTIVEDESATAISNITVTFDTDQWYTLDGRKLSSKPTAAGCYIHNGKKIFVSK